MRKASLCPRKSVSWVLLLWAGLASAQTTGSIVGVVTDAITGEPIAGAQIIATSTALQGQQAVATDETGAFRLIQLPPGRYQLEAQLEGYRPAGRSDIALRADKTLRADLTMLPETVEMEEQVVQTGMAPVVNVGSAETGVVATKDFMALVPMGRSFQETAALAPMAKRDRFGFGFAGAQSSENNYLFDGLNVTDPRYGTLGTNFLPNFFEEVDVKTGAFMPEYGRTTGGIMSGVLKSGSNEYHGSAWVNWTPRSWVEPEGHPSGRAGEAIWLKSTPRHHGLAGGAYDLDTGLEVGGPIEEDKLWFYAGFAPVFERTITKRYLRWTEPTRDANGNPIQHDIAGTGRYYSTTSKQFQSVGKLTYLFDPDHNLTASLLWAPREVKGFDATTSSNPANGAPSTFITNRWSETIDSIGRYSGKLLDKHLVLEASVGIHYQFGEDRPGVVNGVNQATIPSTLWFESLPLANFEDVPAECSAFEACSVARYVTGGLLRESFTLRRFAGRLSAAYLFNGAGTHNLKGGLDLEVTDFHELQKYSGRSSFTYMGNGLYYSDFYGTVDANGDPTIQSGYQTRPRSVSQAYYLQDSWQVLETGLTLNYGLRWELQNLEDTLHQRASQLQPGDSPQKISINDNVAPRVQAIYDFTGQGRGKIAANWGRFYENIPLHLVDRSFGGTTSIFGKHQCNAVTPSNTPFDPRTAAGCRSLGYEGYSQVSPVAPDLKGMYVDQFGLAAEYEVISDLAVGVEWQARRLGRIIEDMTSDPDQRFFIANPAESKPWVYQGNEMNPRQATMVDPATGRTYTIAFPKPHRDYDGFTIKLTKNLSDNWMAQASYTYSVLRGNYEGFYRPAKGFQTPSPNLTQDYDFASLMQNRTGYLDGDITHQLKLFGAYVFRVTPQLNITAGSTFSMQSGTPLSVLGSYPGIGRAEVFLVPRGQAGRSPLVTQIDLKGQLEYLFSPPYALKFTVEIFNLFNRQTPTNIDQNYTYDFVQPIPGAQCRSRKGANAANPVSSIQNDCPDLRHLKTLDGRPVTVNGNYGRPTGSPNSFQLPFALRLGAALTF